MHKSIAELVAIGVAALALLFVGFYIFRAYVAGGTTAGNVRLATTTASLPLAQAVPVAIGATSTNPVRAIILALPDASTFQALYEASSAASSSVLKAKGPYTIFVPTDTAFGKLPAGLLDHLTPAEQLRLVEYHMIKGHAISLLAATTSSVKTLSGDSLSIIVDPTAQTLQINNAFATQSFQGKDGVVYTINAVLFPQAKTN